MRIFGQMREATRIVASTIDGFFTMTTYTYLYRTLGTDSEFSRMVALSALVLFVLGAMLVALAGRQALRMGYVVMLM